MPDSFTEYRISIEGCGAEAVTSPRMEKVTTNGIERIRGLIRDGISTEEEVDIGRAEVESGGMSIEIVDRQTDDAWTTHLSRHPTTRTWLTADMTTSGTNVAVDSTAGFAVDDYIHLATECMLVTIVVDANNLTVIRARRGTIAQAHYTEDGENLTRPVVALTYPYGLQGRRAYIYEYKLGEDDLDGDGNLIWRGIVAQDAELEENGSAWTMQIESLYWLLKQDIGSDAETPFSLRGYFYSAVAPMELRISEAPFGTSFTGSPPYAGVNSVVLTFSGHFETTADLVDEVNTQIAASAANAWSDGVVAGSIVALATEDGSWGLSWEVAGTETYFIESVCREVYGTGGTRSPAARELAYEGYSISAANTAQTFFFGWNVPMAAPRGVWGPHTGEIIVDVDGNNNPSNIYPSGLTLLNVGDTLTLEAEGTEEAVSYEVTYELDASRLYQIIGHVRPLPFFTPLTAPNFTRHTTYVSRGTLADFRDALVANGPTDANRGAAPFLTTSDLASWDTAVSRGARSSGALSQRRYIVAQASKLDEMLSQECRLLGTFLRLDTDGKIGMGYLELPTASTPADFVLDDSNIIIKEQPPSWRPAMFGTLNTARLLTGYDPAEDEHTGRSYDVRDVTSLSIRKKTQQLLVEPKSIDAADFSAQDVTNAFRRVLSVYSRPYAIIPLQVPGSLRGTALIGTVCTITTNRLPNVSTGRRGMSVVKAMVVGRSWNAASNRVGLSLLASNQELLGYTPTVSISSQTGASDVYDFTVSLNDPDTVAPLSVLSVPDMFLVGTRVELMEWDTLTQTPQPGKVSAVTLTTIEVEFDAVATVTGTRYLRFAAADDSVALQESWAYMGTAASVVEFSVGGDKSAPEFSA